MTEDEADGPAGDPGEEATGADVNDADATGTDRETGEETSAGRERDDQDDVDTGEESIREQARSLREALADGVDAPAEQDDHAAAARKSAGDERE